MSGGNDQIKSAFEIALEKAQKLGALSDEEKHRLKDEELAAAGKALAQRYLNGLPLSEIGADLARRGEVDRKVVGSHLLSYLLDRIDIQTSPKDDRGPSAIQLLTGDSEVTQGIRDLLQEYERALERARQENLSALQATKRSELEREGISGSAVEPAIENSPDWVRIRQNLNSYYEERLEQIKRKGKNSRL